MAATEPCITVKEIQIMNDGGGTSTVHGAVDGVDAARRATDAVHIAARNQGGEGIAYTGAAGSVENDEISAGSVKDRSIH